jgi:ssRNA-specific RNase YbeY (16S rRNA maturation enzyme)
MADKVKKTKTAAKPRKTAAKAVTKPAVKKEKAVQRVKVALPSRAEIEQLARQYWAQRGYTDGYAEQDWLRAEQELLKMAS